MGADFHNLSNKLHILLAHLEVDEYEAAKKYAPEVKQALHQLWLASQGARGVIDDRPKRN